MNASWILAPVMQAVILGTGLIGCVALWISVKIEARSSGKKTEVFRRSVEAAIKDLESKIEELRKAPAADPIPAGPRTVEGLNLTTRAKALRMSRRGEPISSIAAALGVQQEEVELLLKLDRLLEVTAA